MPLWSISISQLQDGASNKKLVRDVYESTTNHRIQAFSEAPECYLQGPILHGISWDINQYGL